MDQKTHQRGPRRQGQLLSGSIARDIGVQILSGRYKPGDLLPGEIASSLRLHVSRTTYREAMRILCAKGMVEMRRHIGTRVTPVEQWHMLDREVLGWTLQFSGGDFLGSISELRRTLEPEIAALAASKRSASQLANLQSAMMQMQTPDPPEQSIAASVRQFRMHLFRSSHNLYLESLLLSIDEALGAFLDEELHGTPGIETTLLRYSDVLDAVARQDAPSARQAMILLLDGISPPPVRRSLRQSRSDPSGRNRSSPHRSVRAKSGLVANR